ncbi:hypothetical protein D3C75_368360 [compost metagenome]
MDNKFKITIDNFSGKRIDGIITNQPVEFTEQHMEIFAEAILQVLYNVGVHSKIDLNFDLRIQNGTTFYVHGTDVMVTPPNGEMYNRRIRNNPDIITRDK